MAEPDRTVQVNLRLPMSLKEAAEREAAADHRSLTSLVEKLLADHVKTKPTLEAWHERAQTRLLSVLAERRTQVPSLLARSYSIETRYPEEIHAASILRILHKIHANLANFIPNPEIFYPYSRKEIAPYFVYDPNFHRKNFAEILECVALPENNIQNTEFWRISSNGLASDVRSFPEDHESFQIYQLEPGKWFSPILMARELYSLIQHAYLLSQQFTSSAKVEFRCEWTGLSERQIGDWGSGASFPEGMARVDTCVTSGEWSIDDVRMRWPEIASALGGRVVRLFAPNFDYSAEFIRNHLRIITG
jgi:hypothetical protein